MTPELLATLTEWLVAGDDVQRRHARWRLSQANSPPLASAPIPLAESLELLRLVNLCPYRSRDAACGCSGHRCGLRFARPKPIVSHLDCLDCMRTHGLA